MTSSKTTPETKPAKKAASRRACNVPDCGRKPTTRGLCDAHWASRRGDANPKTTKD